MAEQCTYRIEKEWPGHSRNVLWRRRCKNKTTHPTKRCWVHRPSRSVGSRADQESADE